MPGTVAVTGATGFIGGHVARRLAECGWQVRALARRPEAASALAGSGVALVPGSLEDEAGLARLVEGADAVVHVAGLVKARSRAHFFAANAAGTRRLAGAAAGSPTPPRFVLVSSLAAREPQLSDYAASKRAGEEALRSAGLPDWVVLRPPAVYGPGDREILAFFRAVSRGIGAVLGTAQARLSMLHAADLADAVAVALAYSGGGRIVEVHDGRAGGYAWPELIATAAAALGRRPPRPVYVPAAALRLAAWSNRVLAGMAGRPAMLTPGKARELLHPDWVVRDSTLPGWQPAIPLAEGFRATVQWYRREGWL